MSSDSEIFDDPKKRFGDFALRDYEMKVTYLTNHFQRMWTRFNYFVGIESALAGGKLIFGGGKLSTEVAIVGAIVSLIWYFMGAEDRFLVRVYRGHVSDAADLLANALWKAGAYGPYRHVGEVAESSKGLDWQFSAWRVDSIAGANNLAGVTTRVDAEGEL